MQAFQGTVVHGKKLGRTIGFPTCNLSVVSNVALQAGVYGVEVEVKQQRYVGVMNIGTRPTIDDGQEQTVEVHILQFADDVYGEELHVTPVLFIRAERKFDSLQALVEQLHKDTQKMQHYCQVAV